MGISNNSFFYCNYSVAEGRQPFAERLRRLVCYCVVRCWSLISGQVGEYTDATARRSVAYHD
ncbi:MAG: hypothetical protein LBG58_09150 [Planctomycetaceae bacterium]|jgi:hypothetical protein|nr:hypothetical protein [Planctomycetaceae bacterium]